MFCSVEDFANTWTVEAQKTKKLFSALSDDSLNKELLPEYKTIGRLALHMINNLCNTAPRLGFNEIEKPESGDTAKGLAADYKRVSDDFLRQIQSNWTDHMLKEKISLFGAMFTRSEALGVILLHQIHHRAQITVLMRLAGLGEIPGMYGPSASDQRKEKETP